MSELNKRLLKLPSPKEFIKVLSIFLISTVHFFEELYIFQFISPRSNTWANSFKINLKQNNF